MSIYDRIGVRPVINANATLTRLGGSLMPPPVLDAMREAAACFVDMHELQRVVGGRIAALTRNEAALVCTGASAGLFLSTLACMTRGDMDAVAALLERGPGSLPRRDVVIHRGQRNPYDPAIKLAGARLVEIGNAQQTFDRDLEQALTEQTAAIFYFAGTHLARGVLPLERVIEIARARGVPVVVDAAAQLPPVENLWRFTELGADMVIFSGGKGLRGPQASGLILGRKEWIAACEPHAAPNQRFGRPMKVGKEEMLGLLAAVELFVARDHAAYLAHVEQITAMWIERLAGLPGVSARREFPGEAGQGLPRAVVSFDESLGLDPRAVQRALSEGDPRIEVALAGKQGIYLNADLLQPGEERIVLDRLCAVIRNTRS